MAKLTEKDLKLHQDAVDPKREHHCHAMGKGNLQMAISAGGIVQDNYSEVQFSNDYHGDRSKQEGTKRCEPRKVLHLLLH